MTINNSTLNGNSVSPSGGAIYNYGLTVVITNRTMSGNSAAFGGSIFNDAVPTGSAQVTIHRSTLTGNSGSEAGGGIYNYGQALHNFASVMLTESTISGNSARAGAGIYNDGFNSGNAFLFVSEQHVQRELGVGERRRYLQRRDKFIPQNAVVSLRNCTMSGNSAGTGGAILNDGDTGPVQHWGSATARSAAIQLMKGAAFTVRGNYHVPGDGEYNPEDWHFRSEHPRFGSGFLSWLNLSNDSGGGFLTAVGDQTNANPHARPASE